MNIFNLLNKGDQTQFFQVQKNTFCIGKEVHTLLQLVDVSKVILFDEMAAE